MHRVGLFAGYPIFKKKKAKGVIVLGAGAASDGEDLSNSFYLHLIYDQQFKISDKVKLGIGALVSYNLYKWKFNLLPTLDLKLNAKNRMKINWDSFEYDFLIQKWISLALSVRYDLSFYNL